MDASWEIRFGTTWSPLNPDHGYDILIQRNGVVVFRSRKHPVTGSTLDYEGCLEVAAMYGPARAEREVTS